MKSFQISEPVLKHWLEQLSTAELEGFNTLIQNILSHKREADKIQKELELLEKINKKIDKKVLTQLELLQKKQSTRTLTDIENKEYLEVIEQIENFDAQRVIYLGQLAQLKNIPVLELIKTLKIYPKVNGEIIHS